jgi:hypothetical protein
MTETLINIAAFACGALSHRYMGMNTTLAMIVAGFLGLFARILMT